MSKFGIFLVGARGNIGTLTITGLMAIQENLARKTGLVTALPEFASADLPPLANLVIGGCDVSDRNLAQHAAALASAGKMIPPQIVQRLRGKLLTKSESIGRCQTLPDQARPRELVASYEAMLNDFKAAHGLKHLVVIDIASTEATPTPQLWHNAADDFAAHLEGATDATGLTHAMLWAYAAFNRGCAFVNFTPTRGSEIPALSQLAKAKGCVHAGRDGKTGETLLKTVLGPMFVQRNLKVRSWLASNYLGNNDGAVLADPAARSTKLASKDEALRSILGGDSHLMTDIGFAPSLGDWKTAMDLVHFEGFLGTPMTLQFTWQGCDSALAAPLVIDLARLCGWAMERGETGALEWLAPFFKSPLEVRSHGFAEQMHGLFARFQGR